MYKKRWPLRVSACGKRTKRTEADKQQQQPKEGEEEGAEGQDEEDRPEGQSGSGNKRSGGFRDRDEDKDPRGKRPRGPNNGDNALRRFKHKVGDVLNCIMMRYTYYGSVDVCHVYATT